MCDKGNTFVRSSSKSMYVIIVSSPKYIPDRNPGKGLNALRDHLSGTFEHLFPNALRDYLSGTF